jgi:hypothetical protein
VAERSRRIGCGCLPLVGLFLIGSLVALLLGRDEPDRLGGSLAALVAGLLIAGVIVALASRSRRRQDSEDQITAARAAPPVRSSPPGRSSPANRSQREVRTGTRGLATEPESEEAQALKRRLTEAVSDLADAVEEMPERERPLTSEEMIARAKDRIRQRAESPDV